MQDGPPFGFQMASWQAEKESKAQDVLMPWKGGSSLSNRDMLMYQKDVS
jgi:hypothetical protein